MPVKAIVLIKVDPKTTKDVLPEIRLLKDVKISCAVMGKFDGILYVEFPSPAILAQFITSNVREIKGVIDTQTLFVLKEEIANRELLERPFPFKAFLFAKTSAGAVDSLCRAIANQPGVAFSSIITGEHDIVAFISVRDVERLLQTILSIKTIPGIGATETFVASG
jgi:DNA-binding Lrp family transcriptional regulator